MTAANCLTLEEKQIRKEEAYLLQSCGITKYTTLTNYSLKGRSMKIKSFLLSITAVILLPLLAHAGLEEHIVETGSGFYYTVQKGDTLWDLSQDFSDSPWQWPDLWHYNPDIPNPHLIYPGQRVRIYQKSWEEMQKEQPVVVKSLQEPERFHIYSGIHAVGFIRETAAVSHGSLFKAKEDKQMISSGDKVFIRPTASGNLQKGSLFTVYRTTGPINNPATRKLIGIQHLITGVVEITEIKDGFTVGRIHSAFREIRNDDMLMPFLNRSEKIRYADSVPGLEGFVIKGEDDQMIIGEHTTAFIDKGSDDAIRPGQIYSVYYQETAPTAALGSTTMNLTQEHIGKLMVVHTEKTTSTALMINSRKDIKAGMPIQPVPEDY